MAYDGEPALLRDQVAAVRDVGCEGAILFAYDPAKRDLLDAFAEAQPSSRRLPPELCPQNDQCSDPHGNVDHAEDDEGCDSKRHLR